MEETSHDLTVAPARAGIARKVGLILLVPFCGAMVAALLFWHLLHETAAASDHIALGGRQRMLTMQLADWAQMVMAGQDEDRDKLRELVFAYDRVLAALEHGGELDGRHIDPVSGALRDDLGRHRVVWDDGRPTFLTIADSQAGSPESEEAIRRYQSTIGALTASARGLSRTLEARTKELHAWMLRVFAADVALNLLLLVVGLRYARRHVVRPVLEVEAAAKRVSEGDYRVRVLHGGGDELSRLAGTFNDMASRIEGLLAAVDLRRRYAETLCESLPLGTALLDEDLRVLRTNRSFREMFPAPGAGSRGTPIEEVLPIDGLRDALLRVVRGGEPQTRLDAELVAPAGVRPLRMTAAVTDLGDEDLEARLLLVVEDHTVQERLRVGARAAEESFRSLIEGSPEAIAVHRDGRFVYVNPALVKALGYERSDDIVGTSVLDFVHPDHRAEVVARVEAMLETGEPAPPAEERFLRKDGTQVTLEVVALALQFGGEPSVVAIARDVTVRRDLQAKMIALDRMIAVGTLAAGVGHEINNPLAYVIANLDLLSEELPRLASACEEHRRRVSAGTDAVFAGAGAVSPRLSELIEVLAEAREGAGRVRTIVRDLKTFSRAHEDQLGPVDVRRVLDSSINMAWNEIRHRARLSKDYARVPHVEANEARLGQVFINLLVNAAQAIPEGAAESNIIRVRVRAEGDRVVVEIEDTGTGIPEEDCTRVFDAFFTTKPVGQGTGLGLSICRKTVESHGGDISVRSDVGCGSTFRVSFPAAQVSEATPIDPAPLAVSCSRRGRILVVDDEPIMGRTLQRGLGADHDVRATTSALEAKALLDGGEPFDLIFCDLMMPHMTGMDLHAELSVSAPDHAERMIFLTGGAFTPRARQFLDAVPNLRVDKPFEIKNLRALVRDILR